MKCAIKHKTGEGAIFGHVRLGSVRLLMRMTRASWGMASSSPRLTLSSDCLVGVTENRTLKHDFAVVTCGIMPTQNFVNFRSAIFYL
jgi:hypothetical protein